jgi:hypothetical protein
MCKACSSPLLLTFGLNAARNPGSYPNTVGVSQYGVVYSYSEPSSPASEDLPYKRLLPSRRLPPGPADLPHKEDGSMIDAAPPLPDLSSSSQSAKRRRPEITPSRQVPIDEQASDSHSVPWKFESFGKPANVTKAVSENGLAYMLILRDGSK